VGGGGGSFTRNRFRLDGAAVKTRVPVWPVGHAEHRSVIPATTVLLGPLVVCQVA